MSDQEAAEEPTQQLITAAATAATTAEGHQGVINALVAERLRFLDPEFQSTNSRIDVLETICQANTDRIEAIAGHQTKTDRGESYYYHSTNPQATNGVKILQPDLESLLAEN